jgi:hypothetical protein
MSDSPHRFWNSRGYLPHFDCPGQVQAITCHLGDSLPQAVLDRFERELADLEESERDAERRNRIEAYLDAGWERRRERSRVILKAVMSLNRRQRR